MLDDPLRLGSLTAPGGAELPPIMLPRIKLLSLSIARLFKRYYIEHFVLMRSVLFYRS